MSKWWNNSSKWEAKSVLMVDEGRNTVEKRLFFALGYIQGYIIVEHHVAPISPDILLDFLEVDEVGMMNPKEIIFGQQVIVFFQRFGDDVFPAINQVEGRVIARGFAIQELF